MMSDLANLWREGVFNGSDKVRYGLYFLVAAGVGLGLGATAAHIWDIPLSRTWPELLLSRYPRPTLFVFWFVIPAFSTAIVWFFWFRVRGERWRRAATFVSATAATLNWILWIGLTEWGNHAALPILQNHRALYSCIVLVGFLLCITSILTGVIGAGRSRWLSIPAAICQGYGWLLANAMLFANIGV